MSTTREAIQNLERRRRVATGTNQDEYMTIIAEQEAMPAPSLQGESFRSVMHQLSRSGLLDRRQKQKLWALADEFTEEAFVKRAIAICNEAPDGWDTSAVAERRRGRGPEGRQLVVNTVQRMLPIPHVGDGFDRLRNA